MVRLSFQKAMLMLAGLLGGGSVLLGLPRPANAQVTWVRYDEKCCEGGVGICSQTHCTLGGTEQCSATYTCNKYDPVACECKPPL